jgi:hypothetical protein
MIPLIGNRLAVFQGGMRDRGRVVIFRSAILAISLLTFIALSNLTVAAQSPDPWAPRERIPGSHNEAETPYLVADQNHTVYAFHSQPVGEDESVQAIIYSQWTLEQGWTDPVDIMLPPFGGTALIKGAFLDQSGMIHIIFIGGDKLSTHVYYSNAPAVSAGQARAWSKPALVGENVFVETAALAGDGQGNLFVLYGSNSDGIGLYYVNSQDEGNSWSTSLPIFLTYEETLFAYAVQLHLDQQQQLHAAWSVNNTNGSGQAIYHAKLDADHVTWSDPLLLTAVAQPDKRLEGETIGRIGWPAITTTPNNELMVIYIVCDPCERRMRLSHDGGQTWTEPIQPFPSRGEYGWADFGMDSKNVLHIVLGDREHGLDLWHGVWQNGNWQELEPVVPLSDNQIQEGPQKFHPTTPRVIISQGNIILATWKTDSGSEIPNGTWYSFKPLDAPELPVVALPTPLPPIATSTPEPTATSSIPKSTPSPDVVFTKQNDQQSVISINPATPFVIGVIPVFLLVLGVIVVHQLYHRRNH